MSTPVAESGADTYRAFVDAELTEQRAVKNSLESRGAAVITSAGAIVTLLFALVGFITSRQNYNLPEAAHGWLYLALGLFLLAALLGLFVALPLSFKAPTPAGLQKVVLERWDDSKTTALRRTALTNIVVIQSYKRVNSLKAYAVLTAITFEALAIGCIAAVVKIILDNA